MQARYQQPVQRDNVVDMMDTARLDAKPPGFHVDCLHLFCVEPYGALALLAKASTSGPLTVCGERGSLPVRLRPQGALRDLERQVRRRVQIGAPRLVLSLRRRDPRRNGVAYRFI